MAIGNMRGVPTVGVYEDKVAIWGAGEDGEPIGLVLTPSAAVEAATRLLKVAGEKSTETYLGHDIESVRFQVAHLPADAVGRLELTINGAQLSGFLSEIQVAELAAAFTAAAHSIARPWHGPRKNV